MNTKQFINVNRTNWNERVGIHAESSGGFYDLEGFLAGKSTLRDIEITEIGDVSNKTLLHVMCHFGLDTLSWARRGAEVTGVDFSEKAIVLTRDLAERTSLRATFLRADVLDLPCSLSGQFDIVFASYGVLCWLPDINRFIEAMARCLKPNAIFYLIDGHPFFDMYEYDQDTERLELRYPYFHNSKPEECDCCTSYINKTRTLVNDKTYQWNHDIESILTVLIVNGLELLSLKEYPFGFYQKYPNMVQNDKGQWVFAVDDIEIPLLISVKARKKT
jgi:SAM-dependent methyltransferase